MPLFKKAALDLPRASLPYVDRLFVQLHVVASFLNLTFAPYEFPAAASVLGGLVRHSCGNSNLIHLRYQCHSKWYYTNIFPGLQGFSKKYCSFFDTSSGRLLGAAGAWGKVALGGRFGRIGALGELGKSPEIFAFCPYARRSAGRSVHALCVQAPWHWNYGTKYCICPPTQATSRAGLRTYCVYMLPGIGTMGQNIAFVPYAGDQPGRSIHASRVHVFWHWNYGTKYCICPLCAANGGQVCARIACTSSLALELWDRILHLPPLQATSRAGLCTHCVFTFPGIGTMGQNIAFAPYARRTAGRLMHALRAHVPWHWKYATKYCICPLCRRTAADCRA